MADETRSGNGPENRRPDGSPEDGQAQPDKQGSRRRRRRPRREHTDNPAGAAGPGHGPDRRRPRDRRPLSPAPDEDLVIVRFKGHRKSYYHNRLDLNLQPGDYCLVEADRGRDLGRVTYVGRGRAEWWGHAGIQGVLGRAAAADLARLHDNRGDEWGFWDIAREKIQYRRLKMNLVSVERRFDHKKLTFYFTADKRVDFRELVRDLAAVFRTRIELRQIGVRDEARLKGGMGICGREFCCSSFLHEFVPVTLKMAKVQQLPLNPGKLSGPCGRLRCCMAYEHANYEELHRRLPRVGTEVTTPRGAGRVRKLDLLRGQAMVHMPGEDGLQVFVVADLEWSRPDDLPPPKQDKPGCGGGGCGN